MDQPSSTAGAGRLSEAKTPELVRSDQVERFVRLLGQHQRRLFLYVLSLTANWSDAEDVIQETNLVLWREFDRFVPDTSFMTWACSIAYHQVLAWRKRKQRDRLVFSETFLEAISRELIDNAEELEERAIALSRCLNELPQPHRELIRMRYTEEGTVESIAQGLGRSMEAVYRMLSRIRQTLFDCVNRKMAQRETP
jgi:RNA polymerase sigma-70 factor, ECF subfamily